MAWQKRKHLTKEEKLLRLHDTGGLLNESEQDVFIELVKNGLIPHDAILHMHKCLATLTNTLYADEEFKKEVNDAKKSLIDKVEQSLINKALDGNIVETKTWRVKLDGTMVLKSVRQVKYPGDNYCLGKFLSAYNKEIYNETINLNHSQTMAEQDGDQVRNNIRAKLADLMKAEEGSEGLPTGD